jgi:hypothetical protein
MKRVAIPISVDVKALIRDLNLSKTRAKNLRQKVYYFLSRLVLSNSNYRLRKKSKGYCNLCSKQLKALLLTDDYYLIKKQLLNPNDPIIQIKKGQAGRQYKNKRCKSYRLVKKHNTGLVTFVTLSKKFSKRLDSHNEFKVEKDMITEKYGFLINQYNTNDATFDPKVYHYINRFAALLNERMETENVYQEQMLKNIIGRWVYNVKKIKNKQITVSVSPKNHRLNSILTHMPRKLRGFIRINGEKLICIDISSSHNYILCKIMQRSFFIDKKEGFNLYTIYPTLYYELINRQLIIEDSNVMNYKLFMWSEFFTDLELINLNYYTQSPFDDDFYLYTLKKFDSNKVFSKSERDAFKGEMMRVLYDKSIYMRNLNDGVCKFKSVFPAVDKWILQMHSLIDNKRFALLLQRAESYLLLYLVGREFNRLYPDAPLFTIHDSLHTTEPYIEQLYTITKNIVKDVIGIEPGVKIKPEILSVEPKLEDVDEEWKKIAPIISEQLLDNHIGEYLKSNVQIGLQYLKKN